MRRREREPAVAVHGHRDGCKTGRHRGTAAPYPHRGNGRLGRHDVRHHSAVGGGERSADRTG